MMLDAVVQVVESEIGDDAGVWQGSLPMDVLSALADQGFLGVNFAEEYGGAGMTELEAMLLIEAAGRVAPDVGYLLNTATMLAPRAVALFGSETAKERYLPPVLDGEELLAIAISEPGAGSDAGNIETTAEPDGDDYTLDGEKTWVSVVPESSAAVVWVRFPDAGLGAVVVDLNGPGVEASHEFTNMAGHTQSQLFFDDAPVPAENVLTRGPDGFADVLAALNWERLGNAAMTNGMAAFALDEAIAFAGKRKQFGQAIGEFQGIGWKLADAATDFEASRALARQAAVRAVADDRTPSRLDASVATLYSARMAERVVSEALQIHGAMGYMRGNALEYLYRLVRGWRIGAGTDEIQKNQIADALTEGGLPKGY